MPHKPTPKSNGLFNSMKIVVMNAKAELFRRELEALNQGNTDLANALFAMRRELDEETLRIGEAQRAYLLSPQAMNALIAKLQGAVNGLKDGKKKLEDLKTALDAAAKFVRILADLVPLVS